MLAAALMSRESGYLRTWLNVNCAWCRDIAAEPAEIFGERAFDHVNAVFGSQAYGLNALAIRVCSSLSAQALF